MVPFRHGVSIHALLAECDSIYDDHAKRFLVSIHALLAECDRCTLLYRPPSPSFNPRTPCGVRRRGSRGSRGFRGFQSTHSLRSATHIPPGSDSSGGCFNPRTPCGVRQAEANCHREGHGVSIHALLAECDSKVLFESPEPPVSIHALLAECDSSVCQAGEQEPVSIHALLAECDPYYSPHAGTSGRFNPRTPCGVRLVKRGKDCTYATVSIHALLAECDCARPYTLLLNRANHTLRQPP